MPRTRATTISPTKSNRKGVAVFYLSESPMTETDTNLFRKRILKEGKFVHPNDPTKWLVITKDHLADAVKNFASGVMDKVQLYWTHDEDPRNITGSVVGLEEGIDPEDKKPSLYALIKTESPEATEYAKKNMGSVSARIDHTYREHDGGKEVGLTVKHVALVGQGWIHNLGKFFPLPASLEERQAYLEEHKESGFTFVEDEDENLGEEDDTMADGDKTKEKEKEHAKVPTLAELKVSLSEHGINVDELTKAAGSVKDLTENFNKANGQLKTIAKNLNLAEGADVASEVTRIFSEQNDRIFTTEAEKEVNKLLGENKITPAQVNDFVTLYKQNKPLYASMTANLTAGKAVPLGESGKKDGKKPGEGEANLGENIERYRVMAEEMKIPVSKN